jgi:hypothetical protein
MRTIALLRSAAAAASLSVVALAAAPARADGADPTSATQVQKYQAQQLLVRGRELARRKNCKDAVVEFRVSLNIVASPNTRLALARCLVEMNALADAYAELSKTVADARALAAREARYTETADAADADRKELATKVVLLTLKIDHLQDDATIKIGDKDVARDALAAPIVLAPGTIEVVVSSGGKEAARTTLTVGPGDTTVTMDAQPPAPKPPEPPPAPPPPPTTIDPNDTPWAAQSKAPPPPPPAPRSGLRTAAWISGGVGVAGLAVFGVFGALEKGTYSDLQSACHNGPCPASKQDDVSTGKTQQTIANIGLVVGAVGLATGVTLFVLSAPSSPKSSDAPAAAPAPPAAIVVSPSFIGVRGAL